MAYNGSWSFQLRILQKKQKLRTRGLQNKVETEIKPVVSRAINGTVPLTFKILKVDKHYYVKFHVQVDETFKTTTLNIAVYSLKEKKS